MEERKRDIQHIKDWVSVYYYGSYKTAIPHEKPLYSIVTRVNHHTACLWLKHRHEKVKNGSKGFVELPMDKPNWLVMTRNFRRMQDEKIQKFLNLSGGQELPDDQDE